jgi:carboxypeptidase Taq
LTNDKSICHFSSVVIVIDSTRSTFLTPHAAYSELLRRSYEQSLLHSCVELLGWDELTYMPRGAVEHRGQQLSYLTGLQHDLATDPRIEELLAATDGSELTAEESSTAVNLRGWRRSFLRARRVPRSLMQELMSVATTAQQEWVEARRNNDFAQFLPWLNEIVRLKQQEAACLNDGGPAYDALLAEFEPGMTSVRLDAVFGSLKRELESLLSEVPARRRKGQLAILRRNYPADRQRIFIESISGDLGFDFDRGRLDVTTHPFFSSIGPGDVRITTRFNQADFGEAFFAALHEVGHALFEQGLDPDLAGTPAGACQSLGLHESQSRFWENCIGRGRAFWTHVFPRAREMFHDALHDVRFESFLGAVNHIEPGAGRVRADEATYNLHIFIRYELEQALISGDLKPADLPAVWNERYRDVLGVVPADDAEGCLQDSHWSSGQFGYFPTYALGNIFAAHLYAALQAAVPDVETQMSEGEFGGLRGWLKENVYRAPAFDDAWTLVERVVGTPIDPKVLANLLRSRLVE